MACEMLCFVIFSMACKILGFLRFSQALPPVFLATGRNLIISYQYVRFC